MIFASREASRRSLASCESVLCPQRPPRAPHLCYSCKAVKAPAVRSYLFPDQEQNVPSFAREVERLSVQDFELLRV